MLCPEPFRLHSGERVGNLVTVLGPDHYCVVTTSSRAVCVTVLPDAGVYVAVTWTGYTVGVAVPVDAAEEDPPQSVNKVMPNKLAASSMS